MQKALRNALQSPVAALIARFGVSQLLILAATPLLARIYGPSAFGAYGVYITVVVTVIAVASLRADIQVARHRSVRELVGAIRAAVGSSTAFGIATSLLMIAIAPEGMTPVYSIGCAIASGLLVLLLGLQPVVYGIHFRRQRPDIVGKARLRYAIGQVMAQIGLGLIGTGSIGLLVGQASGALASNLRDYRTILALVVRRPKCAVKAKLLGMGADTAITAISSVSLAIPALSVAYVYGVTVAGAFFLAHRLTSTPIQLGVHILSQYFSSQQARDFNKTAVREVFFRATGAAVIVGVVACPVIWAAVPLVLGAGWDGAREFALILVAPAVVRVGCLPISQMLLVRNRRAKQLLWEMGRMALVGGAVILAILADLRVDEYVMLHAVVSVVAYSGLAMMVLKEE